MFEQVPITLQQDVLALLLFCENGKIVYQLLPIEAWASDPAIYHLAKSCYRYWESYNDCPKSHIYTLIDSDPIIPSDSKLKLQKLVESLELKVNVGFQDKFVIDKIKQFHKISSLKRTFQECIPLLDDYSKIDELENKLTKGLNKSYESFDPGNNLLQGAEGLLERLLNGTGAISGVPFGIPLLDNHGLRAGRGKMLLFMGSSGRGKTWFMVHMGKQSMLNGDATLHLTLELPSEDIEERYLQSMFALYTVAPSDFAYNQIDLETGDFKLRHPLQGQTGCLYDIETISEKMKILGGTSYFGESNLQIKFFPTNTLTIQGLEAYLDALASTQNFYPKTVIIDYPDCMKINDPRFQRFEIGQIYKELRRIASERDFALICCTQSNRSGGEAQRLEMKHMAEDISKYQTCDICLTWSATDFERNLGLGRLYVAKARKVSDSFEILVAQNLTCGQFHMSSIMLNKHGHDLYQNFKKIQKETTDET